MTPSEVLRAAADVMDRVRVKANDPNITYADKAVIITEMVNAMQAVRTVVDDFEREVGWTLPTEDDLVAAMMGKPHQPPS